jgi:putative Mg2+ transporter-C (MgtC) family protein
MRILESSSDLVRIGPELLIYLAVSFVAGFLLGIEREQKGKPAGHRTVVMIAAGACLFTYISRYIAIVIGGGSDGTRIAAQIVSGIGFIGAGTILQTKSNVVGLTTAALIWTTAAIGMTIGFGYPLIGLGVALILFIFLKISYIVERIALGKCHYSQLEIHLEKGGHLEKSITDIMQGQDARDVRYKLAIKNNQLILKVRYCDLHLQHHRFLADLYQLGGIKEIKNSADD